MSLNYSEKIRFAPAMAWAEIDLKAVGYNFDAIKKAAGPKIKILCVVKAVAYGHGNIPIAKLLEKKGVDFFGISDIHEGIVLRKAGIKRPILMVENTLPEHAKYLVDHQITPIVCTLELARALNRLGAQKRKKIAVHIKVDTGMGRLGIAPEDVIDFVKALQALPWIRVEGICTHFPLSDSNSAFTRRQIKDFLKIVYNIQRLCRLAIPFVHASNSMGIVVYDKKDFSLVRAGLILYGMYPSPKIRSKILLKPVMSVKSRVTFIKDVAKGTGISYGHRFITPRKMKIATVAIGYNDGYFRAFSNKADVLIHGQRCPVLGTVTMDQIMADVSHMKDVSIGDEVCVLGRQGRQEITADELAKIAGTINYEITCSLGSRVPRINIC
jgi:alanine racemase